MVPARSTVAARRFVPPRSTAHTSSGDEVDDKFGVRRLHGAWFISTYHQRNKKSGVKPPHSKSTFTPAVHIEAHRRDEYAALHHVLRPVLHVQQRHSII